jgi:ppGpp synthetase/RelA/SpoT-type nucleotidyltranferase
MLASSYAYHCKILVDKHILHHSITSRAKTPEKLKEKFSREGKDYKDPLKEITDLAGVRIITYFTSDVEKLIPIIEEEFQIDWKNSVDKRIYDDPSLFGYKSYHYVLTLSQNRCKLPEYSAFKGMRCEVQIRTILQHAWAEIEHDVIYKNIKDVPFVLKREFACLAGVLELADSHFDSLREKKVLELNKIEKLISKKKFDLPIEMESMRYYLIKIHNEKIMYPIRISKLIKILSEKNISTIEQFHAILSKDILSKADQACRKIKCSMVSDLKNCLLRYYIGICYALNFPWKIIKIASAWPLFPNAKTLNSVS